MPFLAKPNTHNIHTHIRKSNEAKFCAFLVVQKNNNQNENEIQRKHFNCKSIYNIKILMNRLYFVVVVRDEWEVIEELVC